jgi:EAL domain-containing protein (putative c-di-GMP-specific phosphodiesterase class I)
LIEERLIHLSEKQGHLKNIVFEIVESEELSMDQGAQQFIERMKYHGAKIAIDDFGSGYSNFDHVLKLKADFIKIDGSLVRQLETDRVSRVLVENIITFSRRLGMKTIAEFVDKESLQKLVVELGIDFSQGYYIGKPAELPPLV